MSEILNVLDVNSYNMQGMVGGGGGSTEDLSVVLSAQDTALSTQETKIAQLEQALNNKVALDLTSATSDANATANDIVKDKTAYVNGVKLTGTVQPVEPNWSEIGYTDTPSYLLSQFDIAKNIYDEWNPNNTTLSFSNRSNIFMFPLIDTSNVTMLNFAWSNCTNLQYVPSLNLSNVTSMYRTFYYCSSLSEINLKNTSNVTNMTEAFAYCSNLVNIGELDATKLVNVNSMFSNSNNIKNLGGFKDLGKAYTQQTANYNNYKLYLSSLQLPHDSLMNVINNLYDLNQNEKLSVDGVCQYRQSLVLGSTNLAKLTAEEIAIATNKGWDVT